MDDYFSIEFGKNINCTFNGYSKSNSSVKVPLRCDEFGYNPTIPEKMWLESNNYEGKYQKIVEAENHQKMYFLSLLYITYITMLLFTYFLHWFFDKKSLIFHNW